MSETHTLLGFDVGERRIGVAKANRSPGIAFAHTTLENNNLTDGQLVTLIKKEAPDGLVIGLPRNQAGEATKQTEWVQKWAKMHLEPLGLPLFWQDESVTSVNAEARLNTHKKPPRKEEVDALAAALILQDYIEDHWHAAHR